MNNIFFTVAWTLNTASEKTPCISYYTELITYNIIYLRL